MFYVEPLFVLQLQPGFYSKQQVRNWTALLRPFCNSTMRLPAIEGDEAAQRKLLHALASGSGLYAW